jgi:hypothetical protein
MEKGKRNTVIVAAIIFIGLLIVGIINQLKRDNALENTVLVVGTIKDMYNTKGATNVKVQFNFNNRVINSEFSTYHWDSLAVNEKVRILVSKKFPDKYIKYVGLAK